MQFHIEGRIEPVHDPKLKVQFYHNGKPVPEGSRYHVTFDFGYVALDISGIYAQDAGTYVCKAVNELGEATSQICMSVVGKLIAGFRIFLFYF